MGRDSEAYVEFFFFWGGGYERAPEVLTCRGSGDFCKIYYFMYFLIEIGGLKTSQTPPPPPQAPSSLVRTVDFQRKYLDFVLKTSIK